MRTLLLAVMVSASPMLLAQKRLLVPTDLAGRQAASRDLEAVLAARTDLPTTIALAASAGTALPWGSAARTNLVAALTAANAGNASPEVQQRLRLAVGDIVDVLTFQPLRQAELPADFPDFQAVDEIELRAYPRYRMASTSMQGGSFGAFMPLFRHIEQNQIAMTAPVQMDWQPHADGSERPARMAFLYGSPTTDPKQVATGVEVNDIAPITVLSIGAIGDDRTDRVERLRARLEAFVAASHGAWRIAGPLRTMGYNSPMVPRDRRYFEVQLPVQRTARDI